MLPIYAFVEALNIFVAAICIFPTYSQDFTPFSYIIAC